MGDYHKPDLGDQTKGQLKQDLPSFASVSNGTTQGSKLGRGEKFPRDAHKLEP